MPLQATVPIRNKKQRILNMAIRPSKTLILRSPGYASFVGWVAMKLVANRDKDRYHLIESLQQATGEQIGEAIVQLRRMHPR